MLRPTGGRIPIDVVTYEQSGLPLGVLVTPLAASPQPRPSSLPEAQHAQHVAACASGAHDLPRCRGCNGYISSKCNMNARYWRCAMCSSRNDLPGRYSATVLAGEDAVELVPEIAREVYDVPVIEEGGGEVPPTAYIFVMDEAGDQAYLDAARMAVKAALDVVEGESLVGVLLYGRYLKFLDVRGNGVFRRVCPLDESLNVAEVFAPDQWLRLTSGKGIAQCIVDTLGKLKPITHDPENVPKRAMGSAVKAVLDMVEAARLLAARVVVIGGGEPNFGHGAIELAEEGAGRDVKDRFPTPVLSFYVDQGVRASTSGAMLDVYLVSRTPVDVASISPLAQLSGGRLILYEAGESTLSQDVWQHLNDPAVVRGLLRLRCSAELKINDVYGCGIYRDLEVEEVFRISCHGHTSTLAADLAFTHKDGFTKDASKMPCVQVAFRGVFVEPGSLPQRVLRVETQTYGASSSKETVRREADANAVATMVFHKALATADEHGIGEARMLLFDWLANLLAKTAMASKENEGEMDIDGTLLEYSSLRNIPHLIFGLIRSFLFRQEAVSSEARASLRCIWEDLSPELIAAAAYPRLYSFLNLEEKSNKELSLSSMAVKESGHAIFMLDAFAEVVIYYTMTNRSDLKFPPPESSAVMRVRAACIRDRPVTPKCIICREGTPKDRWFKALLIEDPVPGAAAQSFSAFMQGVTDSAQELLRDLTQ